MECVNCGQCASVCPTGALTPKPEIDEVWKALNDPKKKVVAQIAPAVRVGLGEAFGLEPGELDHRPDRRRAETAGLRPGLRHLVCRRPDGDRRGQRIPRTQEGGKAAAAIHFLLPGLGEVRRAVLPGLLPNLSTCRSPQQMFGSLLQGNVAAKSWAWKPRTWWWFRSCPARPRSSKPSRPEFGNDGVAGRGPRSDHAGTGADDRGGRDSIQEARAGIARHAVRLQDRRGRDFRRLRRRDRGRAALCRGEGHGRGAEERRFPERARRVGAARSEPASGWSN